MRRKITLFLFLVVACTGPSAGLVGIEVPTGEGRVTAKTPYIIVGVVEGGAADRAGVKPDDIIIQINNRPLKGMIYSDALALLRGKRGETITLLVERGREQMIFRFARN